MGPTRPPTIRTGIGTPPSRRMGSSRSAGAGQDLPVGARPLDRGVAGPEVESRTFDEVERASRSPSRSTSPTPGISSERCSSRRRRLAEQQAELEAPGRRLMAELTIAQALNAGLALALEEWDEALVMGEDVGRTGGVFRITDGLRERFGAARVIDTPGGRVGIVGVGFGMAVAGCGRSSRCSSWGSRTRPSTRSSTTCPGSAIARVTGSRLRW
jgi:hypothetical protein